MAYRPSSFGGGGNPFGFVITEWVKRLLIANAVIFLITGFVFPALVPLLWFVPAEILQRPWSAFTYMFVHGSFFHLFFNMLALFFFGPPLEERWGSSSFLKFYLLTGFSGAVLSLLFPNQAIVGASGAIYGIMVAFAMFWPDNPIYIWGIFPIKAKWLVGGLVAISLISASGGGMGGSGVAHLAHLGGALSAFLYLRSSRAPSQWGATTPRKPRRPRQWKVLSSTSEEKAPEPAKRRTPARSASEIGRSLDEVDRILDKISSEGLSSLTPEERKMLDEASRRFRSN
jgi:membrane associated rhomboid family serine protease